MKYQSRQYESSRWALGSPTQYARMHGCTLYSLTWLCTAVPPRTITWVFRQVGGRGCTGGGQRCAGVTAPCINRAQLCTSPSCCLVAAPLVRWLPLCKTWRTSAQPRIHIAQQTTRCPTRQRCSPCNQWRHEEPGRGAAAVGLSCWWMQAWACNLLSSSACSSIASKAHRLFDLQPPRLHS